jgi:outer membrane autotransporter protein
VSLGGQPLTVNVVNGASTFAGTMSDGGIGGGIGGSLIKSGAGMLILDGNESYTGGTTINAGTLEVGDVNTPGATLAGNVAVNSGGTLMGHGTIGGNVTNGGNVQPGGTVGLLTVAGNYTQSSAGTLTIEITPNVAAGPGIGYDQLLVGGTATLAGGLSVIADPGNYVLGSRYTVLTAAGGRTGTFTSVAFNSVFAGFITPAVSYDPNDVFVTLLPTPAPPAAPGAPSSPPPLFNGGQQVPDMLTAMVSAVQGVGDTVLGDVCGPTAQRLVTQGEGCVVRPLAAGYRAEVWMRGLGGVGSLDGSGARLSFNNSYAGTLIGAGIGQGGFTVGVGGGYLMTALNFSDGSNASQNAGLGFVYGRYAQGPMWFGAMAAYGGGKINGARSFAGTGLTASGNRDADFGIVKAQAAYDIPVGAMTFEPRASLSYIHAGQNGFSESGASILDLTYANTNADVFEGRLVGRVMQRFVAGTWSLVPYVAAGLQETFTGLSRGVTVTDGVFAGSAAGISPAPTAGVVGVGVSAGMTEALDLFIAYQGQFSANQAENTFAAGLTYRF